MPRKIKKTFAEAKVFSVILNRGKSLTYKSEYDQANPNDKTEETD